MSDGTASTQKKHSGLIPFKPGQSGNPAGRTKGARNKLGEAFLEAMHDDFNEHGVEAIQKVRAQKPDQYLKVIASLLPKEMVFTFDDKNEMTDDELVERIRSLQSAVAPFLVDRAGDIAEGIGDEASAKSSSRVH